MSFRVDSGVDKFSKETHSYVMLLIMGKDTKPEILIRSYLFSRSLCFCKNDRRYSGSLDVVFQKYNKIVFVLAVSGIIMRDVYKRQCRNPMFGSGKTSFTETANAMSEIRMNLKRRDGKS